MADDFDDFFDDIVLDNNILAAIETEECKHLHSSQQLPLVQQQFTQHPPLQPQPEHQPSPIKKQKTGGSSKGWVPGVGSNSQADLPEISVDEVSGYGIKLALGSGASSFNKRRRTITSPTISTLLPAAASTSFRTSTNLNLTPGGFQNVQRENSRPTASNNSASIHQMPRQALPTNPPAQAPRLSALVAPSSAAEKELTGTNNDVLEEIIQLRKQMEKLREENAQIQVTMDESVNAKFAKEGEVAILRKGIEKAAKDHADQIARLKAAKEEADTKQQQMQRNMKMEIERIKTEYTFKEHDLLTSARKPPSSVTKREMRQAVPSTPIRIPPEMARWNRSSPSRRSSIVEEPFGFSQFPNPPPQRVKKAMPPPNSPKKTLPGFQNSFTTASPSRRKGKERERSMPLSQSNPFHDEGSVTRFPGSQALFELQVVENRQVPNHDNMVVDIEFDQNDNVIQDAVLDAGVADTIQLSDQKQEVLQLLFSHVSAPSTVPTVQMLLSSQTSNCFQSDTLPIYSKACSRLLETFSSLLSYPSLQIYLREVSDSLVEMAYSLTSAENTGPLAALLDLLSCLSLSVPPFLAMMLRSIERTDIRPTISSTLSTVVQNRLQGDKLANTELHPLARAVARILESLCWNIPTELEHLLVAVLIRDNLLWYLLDPRQPVWLLALTCNALVKLSTYREVGRMLLSPWEPPPLPSDDLRGSLKSEVPYVDRLCSFLLDPSGDGTAEMHRSILALIATLSITHKDGRTELLESATLMPSLVTFIGQLVTPLWEDDEELLASVELTTSTIRLLNQTLFLLYHLVHHSESVLDLRAKLYTASIKRFNGVIHTLNVAFGRLSFSEPPEWIPEDGKFELARLADAAQELLSLVVDGPELEAIWTAFQMDEEEEPQAHADVADADEEMQLMLMDDDDSALV